MWYRESLLKFERLSTPSARQPLQSTQTRAVRVHSSSTPSDEINGVFGSSLALLLCASLVGGNWILLIYRIRKNLSHLFVTVSFSMKLVLEIWNYANQPEHVYVGWRRGGKWGLGEVSCNQNDSWNYSLNPMTVSWEESAVNSGQFLQYWITKEAAKRYNVALDLRKGWSKWWLGRYRIVSGRHSYYRIEWPSDKCGPDARSGGSYKSWP